MVQVFADVDAYFGGGYARRTLAGYLATDIAVMLRTRASARIRQSILSTTAQLCNLCGFMCFDDELHATAQRYYLTALQLAVEAGDRTTGARVLAELSAQADWLGHSRSAFELAARAVSVAGAEAPLSIQAYALGRLAVATAATGTPSAAHNALHSAAALDRHDGRRTMTLRARSHAQLAEQTAAVFARLGDLDRASKCVQSAIRYYPIDERRSRALLLARLAQQQLHCGELSRAVATSHRFLDDYPHLISGRVTTAWRSLRSSLRPYHRNATVSSVLHRGSTVRPRAAAHLAGAISRNDYFL
jgi:tetratricopeptide (TPR) repeat protein